jgi:uncharacterized SAM-binding protein YcdF (DUF218 family)
MSLRRRLAIICGIILAVAGALYLTSLAFVIRAARDDQQRPVGAIVVLGAAQYNGKPSPVLKARLRHALGLYQLGYAPVIVVTGGTASGDDVSEAEAGRRYLISEGVADSAVLMVPEGRNTDETMDALADWVRQAEKRDVLLVSDGFHMARLRVEARRHGLHAWTTPAVSSPISGPREWSYFLAEGWKFPVAWLRDDGAAWPEGAPPLAP